MRSHYDVIILGTGAGGGTLAFALAETGKSILLVERGTRIPREKENWNANEVTLKGRYNPKESWRAQDGSAFSPGVKYAVGGNTKVYGAALLRLRPEDFSELQHEGGVSPAWPLSYKDFEPWYTKAEQLYQVRGKHGSDPLLAEFGADYPHGPIRHEARTRELLNDFESQGLKPWPLPLGLLLNDDKPQSSPCIRCDTCDGFPCLVQGKADAQTICVEPALKHENVELLEGAKVERLMTNSTGTRVMGVEVLVDGKLQTFKGDTVIVSCGAVNSAALLLRSKNEHHPNGLGNSSGMLGRNYMHHQNSAVFALSGKENHSVLQKTWGLGDFYLKSNAWEFPMGLIQPLNRTPAEIHAAWDPGVEGDYTPEYLATHSLEFWITTEDLPQPENRVSVEPDGTICVSYTRNNTVAHDKLTQQLGTILQLLEGPGFDPEKHYRPQVMPIHVNSHQCGTARFGEDPRTSVLDLNCKFHDLENVYVVDASFFPSSGAVNPSLTIIANALRVAEYLKTTL